MTLACPAGARTRRFSLKPCRFPPDLGRFSADLGRFSLELGRSSVDLGWFSPQLGRFLADLGWFSPQSDPLESPAGPPARLADTFHPDAP
jgi:hypothetical protein